ncbi:hypothetical protein [Phormidium tenue]|uniref:hypothetical protein n=1 Tax=Phormidium tenue TaxID=126344 RepID=UPI0015C53EB0|nr:hypothetical protein [Phormidium tenue]MBD2234784.1 hypothetical protein [Phormidium tenue FACHB-1052]
MVSPGAENRRRDYLEKRNQYKWRGIGEATFEGKAVVESPTFPDWAMTAEAMLAVG